VMNSRRRWFAGVWLATALIGMALTILPGGTAWAQAPAAGAAQQADPPGSVRVRDVVYGRKLGVALTMDVFKPAKPNGIGVIWMVSGGWVSRHEGMNWGLARPFTERGMTVFEVVHGSQPKFTLPEVVEDIHRAVRYIRTHAAEYGVDPERLGIGGASAGGHLSLMMAGYGGPGDPKAADPVDRASSAVQAVAAFYPPTDFLNYGKEGQRALSYPPLRPFWHVFALPATATDAEKDAVARRLSPVYGLAAGGTPTPPPTLLIHGDADALVPLQQSETVMAALKARGVQHELVVKKGAAHGWPGIESDRALLADWFAKHLSKPSKP